MVTYEEEIEIQKRRRNQMMMWLRNKNVKQWRRVIFLLYQDGEQLRTCDINTTLRASHTSVYKVLKKLEIGSYVRCKRLVEKGKVALGWSLTNLGEKEVVRCQRSNIIPDFYKRFNKG